LCSGGAGTAAAQPGTKTSPEKENPYFVTYTDELEDRGELELELLATGGPACCNSGGYVAPWLELEYGVTSWWTTELYLEGVHIADDGSAFTGWRSENRFRLFKGEHAVNPILYIEYEDINEASRIQKEIVGSGPLPRGPIALLKEQHARELEGKLILSSDIGPWNVAENAIVEKNFSEEEGVEFGYAVGVSRTIGRWVVGAEAYGGLGSTIETTLSDTRQFIAPIVGWRPPGGNSFVHVSIGFGLTDASDSYVLRVGYSVTLR
jgi:hypothetical protein